MTTTDPYTTYADISPAARERLWGLYVFVFDPRQEDPELARLITKGVAGPYPAPVTGEVIRSFDASDSVTLEFETVAGERPVRTLNGNTRVYGLRRPDGRGVLLNRRYVEWIERTEPVVECTQAAGGPLGPVAFRYTDGQALGFVMPIRDNRSDEQRSARAGEA